MNRNFGNGVLLVGMWGNNMIYIKTQKGKKQANSTGEIVIFINGRLDIFELHDRYQIRHDNEYGITILGEYGSLARAQAVFNEITEHIKNRTPLYEMPESSEVRVRPVGRRSE